MDRYLTNPIIKALVVYIGEGYGGCTADDQFHEHYDSIEDDEIFNKVVVNYERWWGLHDYPQLGKYSEDKGEEE